MTYATEVEDAPCQSCGLSIHLHDDPPCACGYAWCEDHACPVCSLDPAALTVYSDLVQGSDEWHAIRRGMVTASTVGRLITRGTKTVASNDESRGLTALLVSERITGHTEDTFMSSDMFRGVMDEPRARAVYTEHYAPVTEAGFMVRDLDHGQLGYSPDGLVGDDGLIEVKSRRPKKHLQTILANQVPAENLAQLQAGLLVSGRQWGDYISYCGGMPMWVKRIYPDPDWFDAITVAVGVFEVNATQMVGTYRIATKGLPATERIDYMEVV